MKNLLDLLSVQENSASKSWSRITHPCETLIRVPQPVLVWAQLQMCTIAVSRTQCYTRAEIAGYFSGNALSRLSSLSRNQVRRVPIALALTLLFQLAGEWQCAQCLQRRFWECGCPGYRGVCSRLWREEPGVPGSCVSVQGLGCRGWEERQIWPVSDALVPCDFYIAEFCVLEDFFFLIFSLFKYHGFFLPSDFWCMLTAGTFLADGSGAIGISKYVATDLNLNRLRKLWSLQRQFLLSLDRVLSVSTWTLISPWWIHFGNNSGDVDTYLYEKEVRKEVLLGAQW